MHERGKYKAALAASTGGHLTQLLLLSGKMDIHGEPTWITFDHAQSRSMLAGYRDVVFVPYIGSRDWRNALKAFKPALRTLLRADCDIVVSTGAGIAVPIFLAALMTGVRPVYVESASRFEGPSLTGRIVSRMPGVTLFCQHASWAVGRWRLAPSVLDEFEVRQIAPPSRKSLRVFVTLGTIQPFRFDRMVDAVLELFGPEHRITWQLGATSRANLPGQVFTTMSKEQVEKCVREADVVISHAGVGSALGILAQGKVPVLFSRRVHLGEHDDDHQLQIAGDLVSRGLAVPVRDGQPLTWQQVDSAMSLAVSPITVAPLGRTA